MEVLTLNRQIFVLFWILPPPRNQNRWLKLRNIIFSCTNLIVHVTCFIASICFAAKYATVNLEEFLYALMQIPPCSCQAYSIICGFIVSSKFSKMFPKLQKIYDENKHLDKSKFMEKADATANFITTILMKHVIIGWFLSGTAIAVFSALHSIIKTRSIQVEQWYVMCKWILPWNQKSVIGWSGEAIYGLFVAGAYLLGNSMFLTFFIGICLYHRAFFNHIQYLVAELTHGNRDPIESKLQLAQVIRFHNSVKEIFSQSAEAFSACILIILFCGMMFLSCSIFQLDLVIRHLDASFALLVLTIAYGSLTLFLYCFCGQSANDTYLNISDCYYNSNWAKLSSELQKYLVLMIANAQRPLYYHGFGLANLELNTYLQLLKTVLSYYMMFKTLTK